MGRRGRLGSASYNPKSDRARTRSSSALSKASDDFFHLGKKWTCIALHRQQRRIFGLVSARDFGRSLPLRMTLSCRDGELRQRKCKSAPLVFCTAPVPRRLPPPSSCYRSPTRSILLRTSGLRNGVSRLTFVPWAARPNRWREPLQPIIGRY